MTVAKDTDVGLFLVQPFACLLREPSSLEQNVSHSNGDSIATDRAKARESALLKIIDISGDGQRRRDPFKLPDHMRTADIVGMQNAGDARKVLDERRIEYAMGIGNHADTHGPRYRRRGLTYVAVLLTETHRARTRVSAVRSNSAFSGHWLLR